MRICLLTSSFPPDLGWDEPARASYELACGLTELDHHVEVISFSRSSAGITKQDGVIVHSINPDPDTKPCRLLSSTTPVSTFALRNNILLWKKYLSLHKANRFDVVDTNSFFGESLLPALAGAAPIVARLEYKPANHVRDSLQFVGESAFRFDNDFVNALKRAAFLVADAIVAPVHYRASELEGLQEKVTTIAHGLDLRQFSPGEKRMQAGEEEKTVVIRGSANEAAKDPFLSSVLASVREKIPQIRYIYLAQDQYIEGQGDAVKSLLREQGIAVDSVIHNKISPATVPLFLALGDVCLLPAPSEWGSYAWMEPMALGIPVVASFEAIANETVKDNEHALLFKQGDSASAAQAIIRLLEDKAAASRITEAARRYVLGLCDRIENARLTETVYRKTIENFNSPERMAIRLSAVEAMLGDFQSLAVSYDKMLYDMLFVHSWRFRMRHWIGRLSGKARK